MKAAEKCWIERKAEALIEAARRSQWRKDIFQDAAHFRSQGFVPDVALAMACDYWLWDPRTANGHHAGI